MQVGFTVLVREGRAEFHFFGRRPGEPRSLVAHAQAGEQYAVLMGRLTYRSELLGALPREAASVDVEDDAALALAAYRAWGADGLARLEGVFALVVWDAAKQLLIGVRDPLGGYPLFRTTSPGVLAFGTCLRPLLDLSPRRSLNLEYLAEFLALPGSSFEELPGDHCAYEGVRRVLPGRRVEVQAPGGRVREQTHWNWLERRVDPGTDRLEELAPRVEQGLRQAVRQHLRGRVASHLSGGMDSTGVALLARDALRSAPGQPPLHAVSAVFDGLGGLDRETPYVESALRQPGIVSHRVRADDLLDYDCFPDPPFHDEPCPGLAGLGTLGALAEAAARAGADTLLTGHGADGLLDLLPFHLADLLRAGRVGAAWAEARAWGRGTNTSAWHFLWRFGLVHLLPAAWRAGLGPLWRGGRAAWDRQGPGTIAPWVYSDFARRHALRERGLAHLREASAPGRPLQLSVALAMLRGAAGDNCRWSVAAPRGMTVIHPFLDPRFVGLCLGIQTRFRQEPGRMKPLLARALRDVLPAEIRDRRRKGHYNAMTHGGLTRNLPVLEALVRRAPVDDLGLFDKDALVRCLQQAALGVGGCQGMIRLDLTLSWLRWYTLQAEWQKPMTPAAVLRTATPRFREISHACHLERAGK